MQRWIIHIDMDAFFASVEQRDHPELMGCPVIVGGVSPRGVVATASYEARQFGVRSAMPITEAKRRCPQGVFLASDHHKYTRVSKDIHGILHQYSPLIEPLSLDEAFLDVSGMERLYPDPVMIACRIKDHILREVDLIASAGVAPNKFLAKLASDMSKPNGLLLIKPGEEQSFLAPLPVRRLWGVGEATASMLENRGIKTIGQVAAAKPALLERLIGSGAYELQHLARGQDDRPVAPDQEPKSVGNEETFEADLTGRDVIRRQLLALSEKVGWRLRRMGRMGRTVSVKIRFASFKTITRSRTLPEPTCLDEVIFATVTALCEKVTWGEGVRLLGVTLSGLTAGQAQESLFEPGPDKRLAIATAVDKLKEKYGETIVGRGNPRHT